MVAIQSHPSHQRRAASRPRRPLRLIQGAITPSPAQRRRPWLGTLHRLTDGALVGLGATLLGLTGLSLHWQAEWARSYDQLQAAQVLEHRLQESAALLEQHHLGAARRSNVLVPTSSNRLIHLPAPSRQPAAAGASPASALSAAAGSLRQMPAGY